MEQTNLFKDIKAWLSKGRAAAFTKFQPIWKSSKYSLRTKINLYSNVGEIKQRRMRCLGHVLLKKYSDFGGGKKKSDSEFLSYNLMLNSGQKFRALRDKKINILTLVLSEITFLNETKNHQLNGWSLSHSVEITS